MGGSLGCGGVSLLAVCDDTYARSCLGVILLAGRVLFEDMVAFETSKSLLCLLFLFISPLKLCLKPSAVASARVLERLFV